MALINCPECGNQISDKAVSCPHCGTPIAAIQSDISKPVVIKPKYKTQRLFAVALTLISLVVLMATKGSIVWGLLFFAGLAWFIVLRILKD